MSAIITYNGSLNGKVARDHIIDYFSFRTLSPTQILFKWKALKGLKSSYHKS